MDDFSFRRQSFDRQSFDLDKSAFFNTASTAAAYADIFGIPKSNLKVENLQDTLNEFQKARLSSFDATAFLPFASKEEDFTGDQEQMKTEHFGNDYQNFAQQQMDFGVNAVDYYRINRSRGPSFNIPNVRKASEDMFAHGLDLLNYFRSNDPNGDMPRDTRKHSGFFDDYRGGAMSNMIPPGLVSLVENSFQYSLLNNNALDANTSNNLAAQAAQATQNFQQNTDAEGDLEPAKKRKLNNQEAQVQQDSLQARKNVTEVNKFSTFDTDALKIKVTKSSTATTTTPEKPAPKKGGKNNKNVKSEPNSAGVNIKFEAVENKSTAANSKNVSPNPKKEDIAAMMKNKNGMNNSTLLGGFKKPENAHELLNGLSVPAEVEEYINNSKIFNQIKAPVIKKIGTLTLEERRVKIEKYMEKRKRRTWNKRVNYDCRKKVADNRLRIKGRFVTKDQAFTMLNALGIAYDPETITNNEIKELLTEKFSSMAPNKKKDGDNTGGFGEFTGFGNEQLDKLMGINMPAGHYGNMNMANQGDFSAGYAN